jgi:hypothetical protein
MLYTKAGYAAALAACITLGQVSSACALVTAGGGSGGGSGTTTPMYLGLVSGCKVYFTPNGTMSGGGLPPEPLGTCTVNGGRELCDNSEQWSWPLTQSGCLSAAPDVCQEGQCTSPGVGVPTVGPCAMEDCG